VLLAWTGGSCFGGRMTRPSPRNLGRKWVKIYSFACSHTTLNIPVNWNYRGLARTMENSPRPLFLLHQTSQLALCIQTGSILLASAKPRFVSDCQMVKCDLSFQTSRIHCSRVQWRQALHHSSRCLRMVILGLCASAGPWKPIS
jgi:hypothetical protein